MLCDLFITNILMFLLFNENDSPFDLFVGINTFILSYLIYLGVISY